MTPQELIKKLVDYEGPCARLCSYCPEENEVKDIDIAECILGKRGNERFNFMANFIISYIKDIILKINNKINKICLSLNLDEELTKNLDNNSKEFLDIVKDNINKIFSINKK